MATRNKIEAHSLVFASLDSFCANHQDPIQNAGTPRWTALSGPEDRERLLFAELKSSLMFADSLKIGRFDYGETSFFCTVGLDLPEDIGFLPEEDLGGGMLTVVLSELSPLPTVSTFEIRNVVEVEDRNSTPNYTGHAPQSIEKLFPGIRCFSSNKLTDEETHRVFFLLCLSTTSRSTLWMQEKLRETLTLIAELSPVAIPYRTLCRSIFDTDPSSMFMALYRCLEALYAYSHTTKLMGRLGIEGQWSDVAQILEQTLSWRPREEQSLATLMRHAVQGDLRTILEAIGTNGAEEGDIFNQATKRIYSLRNTLVHYRPFHHSFRQEKVNWNTLCEAMALLVLDVYNSTSTN